MKYDVVIVASGKGERAKLGYNKVLYKLKNGRTVLEEASHLFIEDNDCVNIILVTNEKVVTHQKIKYIDGGKKRYESVMKGLSLVTSDYVLIHDGARPFLTKKELEDLKKALKNNDAALLAIKSTDTIKYSEDGFVSKTINRNYVYRALTPQGFKTSLIKEAYKNVDENVTDDAEVVEKSGHKVKIVEGLSSNVKLTNPEDF